MSPVDEEQEALLPLGREPGGAFQGVGGAYLRSEYFARTHGLLARYLWLRDRAGRLTRGRSFYARLARAGHLIVMARRADIAAAWGISVRQVDRTLDELAALGWIERVDAGGRERVIRLGERIAAGPDEQEQSGRSERFLADVAITDALLAEGDLGECPGDDDADGEESP